MAIGTSPHRLILAGILATAAACSSPKPRPFAFGEEACTHCHMTLADPRFGAELVLRTGKVLPFDDVGCLATYLATGGAAPAAVHSLWVSDYLEPGALLPAAEAVFLRSDSLRTPMDYRVVALRPGARADSLRHRLDGTLVRWEDVMALVQAKPGP